MPVVDTSWLVALWNASDAHHDEAVRQAREHTLLTIPGPVLVEFLQVVFFGVRRKGGEKAAHAATRQALGELQALSTAAVEPAFDPEATAKIYLRHGSLSYVDAVGLQVAGDTLLSFDEDQLAALAK